MKIVLNFRLIFFILLLVFVFNITNGQTLSDTLIKYFVGTTEPTSDWTAENFDDSGWNTGYHSLGYGDNDDYTIIDTTTSVYARIPFYVTNTEELNDVVMILDFDDAFCASINGIEFARVNLGKHKSATTCNQLADRSHEAQLYRNFNGMVLGYYVPDSIVEKTIHNGQNILAIEVHNDSIKGSDLSMHPFFLNLGGYYDLYDIASRYKASVELDSTHLPILVIETDEFGVEVKRIKTKGTLKVINNNSKSYNKPSDPATDYEGPVSIEIRGESSANFPKQSFDFETQDADGNDTSIALLGMPKENDWVLQGPYADKSQIRNALIYDLGRLTGQWHPRIQFCEVIFNGELVGLYNLIEKIKRDSNRVYVAKIKADEISGNDLTGGYIVKYDKGPTNLQIVYPKEKDLQEEQEAYIRNFFDEYQAVLRTNSGLDPENGYRKYIDPESLINYTILAELGKNCDAYFYSSYMYKDRDDRNDKIIFGPLWDFDLCFGNASWQHGDVIDAWQFDEYTNNRFNIKRLFEDPELVDQFEDRWFELRESYLATDSLLARIDSMISYLDEPIKRNYQVWPVIEHDLFTNTYQVANYEEEIEHIKNYIQERTTWMDETIPEIFYPVKEYPSNTNDFLNEPVVENIYPNPFNDVVNIKVNLASPAVVSACLVPMDGKTLEIIPENNLQPGEFVIHWNKGNELSTGLYILNLKVNGIVTEQYRLVKMKNDITGF
ncbi:MAG: CotH kinase family protein [Bacteroidales bacterium]|nr:CotH kinase family protein [Bacteroidales bacterium]MBN2820497.1 CotH kinase family protein [Bacteroidales bacterium]